LSKLKLVAKNGDGNIYVQTQLF